MSADSAKSGPPAPHKSPFWSCWGCRLLSGTALIGSGFWVYLGTRRYMQQRGPPTMWTITQMTFAIGLFCWGVVVLVDPVGKQKRIQ